MSFDQDGNRFAIFDERDSGGAFAETFAFEFRLCDEVERDVGEGAAEEFSVDAIVVLLEGARALQFEPDLSGSALAYVVNSDLEPDTDIRVPRRKCSRFLLTGFCRPSFIRLASSQDELLHHPCERQSWREEENPLFAVIVLADDESRSRLYTTRPLWKIGVVLRWAGVQRQGNIKAGR